MEKTYRQRVLDMAQELANLEPGERSIAEKDLRKDSTPADTRFYNDVKIECHNISHNARKLSDIRAKLEQVHMIQHTIDSCLEELKDWPLTPEQMQGLISLKKLHKES